MQDLGDAAVLTRISVDVAGVAGGARHPGDVSVRDAGMLTGSFSSCWISQMPQGHLGEGCRDAHREFFQLLDKPDDSGTSW